MNEILRIFKISRHKQQQKQTTYMTVYLHVLLIYIHLLFFEKIVFLNKVSGLKINGFNGLILTCHNRLEGRT
jgi:hypothetical protein